MSDMALAEYRKARSVELRLAGLDYDAIAQEVGYANRGTAWRVVNTALRQRVDAAVEEFREIELARLDALQEANWDKAMAGDIASVNAVLRVIDRRIRLLGLDQIIDAAAAPRSLVLTPDELAAWGG